MQEDRKLPLSLQLGLVALLVIIGLLARFFDLVDPFALLALARDYTDRWWLLFVIVLAQATLYTFALPGSIILWVAAPLYPPVTATIMLTAGSTLGAIGAYMFSHRLTETWIHRIEHTPAYKLLYAHNNFFTQFSFRVFPGFPHSLVSYSSGILRAKYSEYIAGAIVGISIKSYIYARVIYRATSMRSVRELLDISVYGPLILLSILVLAGVIIRRLLDSGSKDLHT